MDLLDANILIGAFRPDDPAHPLLRDWLEGGINEDLEITFPPLVEAAFLRIVTHPGIYRRPSTFAEASSFLATLQESQAFRDLAWTPRMRQRWHHDCRELGLTGNDVNDALLAAMASEGRCRLVSRDRGFQRFRGLAWWNPSPDSK